MLTADEIYQNAKLESEKAIEKADLMVEKYKDDTQFLLDKSSKNIADWREYSHKYYLVALLIIGGTGVFSVNNEITLTSNFLIYGIFLTLFGIFIGFLIINLCFYVERKTFQIGHYIDSSNPYQYYDHPESGGNIALSMKLYFQEINKERKVLLKNKATENKNQIRGSIKKTKSEISLLKYLGGHFGVLEKLWLWGVGLSYIFITFGLILLFLGLFEDSLFRL